MPVFQNPVASLDHRWPLWRIVTEPLRLNRRSRSTARDRARAALDDVGLAELPLDARPGALSVGQCQRVAIARALIADPPLILADEPTASLDTASAHGIVELLRRAGERGTAVVVVSHDPQVLAAVSDRIVELRDGRLVREPVAAG